MVAGVGADFLVIVMALILIRRPVAAQSGWTPAHAIFYVGPGTTAGACGYEDTVKEGYGVETTAVSTAPFNDGLTCGACYEIKCYNSTQWCKPGTIQVTATNLCPPSGNPSGSWCNPPLQHFDLTEPMFLRIAEYKAGIVPVLYHSVPCQRQGGIKFELKGNPNWLRVLVFNVAGAGDITSVKIKGSRTGWIQMIRNWGQNWQASGEFVGQSLSFQVSTSDGKMVESDDVAPANWQFGGVYEGKQF